MKSATINYEDFHWINKKMFSRKLSTIKQLFSSKKVILRNILVASTAITFYKYVKFKTYFEAEESTKEKEEIIILGTG